MSQKETCPNCKKEVEKIESVFCAACEDMETFDFPGEEHRARLSPFPFFLAAF